MDDVGLEVIDGRRPGREDCDPPPAERGDRPQAELDRDHRHVLELADRRRLAAAHQQDEVRDEHAVRVEVRARVLPGPDDEHARIDRHRWDRGPAAVEDDQVRPPLLGELDPAPQVGGQHVAGQPSAGAPAADRRHAGQGGGLQVVGGRVPAGAGDVEQLVERRRDLDELRLGRPAAAHGHDHDVAPLREQAREMAGDGRLTDPLPRADHGERRKRRRRQIRRGPEPKVRAYVLEAERERPARPEHPLRRPEHRLVREVDDDLRRRRIQRRQQRHAVVLAPAQLLRAADEDRPDEVERQLGERVAHDVSVMLAVDERDRVHDCVVTSDSIRAVYFSKESVSVENWMIRSCPWNGYLRHTSTCEPAISTTL